MIEEETGRVVVTDFGIAKLMPRPARRRRATCRAPSSPAPFPTPHPSSSNRSGRRRAASMPVSTSTHSVWCSTRSIPAGTSSPVSADEVELHHRSLDGGECPVRTPHACDHKAILPTPRHPSSTFSTGRSPAIGTSATRPPPRCWPICSNAQRRNRSRPVRQRGLPPKRPAPSTPRQPISAAAVSSSRKRRPRNSRRAR